MAVGDILLFKSAGDLAGELICAFTNGPFSHVAVQSADEDERGNTHEISAHSEDGIQERPLSLSNPRVCRVSIREHGATDASIAAGLADIRLYLKQPYGSIDIFNQVLKVLGVPFYVGQSKRFDCSDLAARYLAYALPDTNLGEVFSEPHLVTPNDVARALHVLPASHAVTRRNPVSAFLKLFQVVRKYGLTGISHPNGQQ